MSTSSTHDQNNVWWSAIRPRLILFYLAVALILLALGGIGQQRLLSQVGNTFGGFFWGVDTDSGNVVVVSTPPQLPFFEVKANSLSSITLIIAINNLKGTANFTHIYQNTAPDTPVHYTTLHSDGSTSVLTRRTATFTLDMWWQNYGLASLAGISWLIVGAILLLTATEWTGAVEGLTLLPPAMLLLLYSHWGNVQRADTPDLIFHVLWVPSFALLGATFIHLSLTYRPNALDTPRKPQLRVDILPYLPLLALLAYEGGSFLLFGFVSIRISLLLSLGYAAIGGMMSLGIGVTSLIRVGRLLPRRYTQKQTDPIPSQVRQRIGDLLTLWIGGVGLGFVLGVLPILLTGQTLLPLPTFYTLAAIYPLVLLYAIRSLRLIDQLHITLQQRETALHEQQKTATELRHTNSDLQQATSLLLHADAHLRSILSQRIHDQPKQQALRIRSLLGHWQHKLRVEAERDPEGKVVVKPLIEALGKVRKISEELEGDLRGLQLLIEDVYQRRSLGLKLHLEKLIREDLPALHPESLLQIQPDLWALDTLNSDLEETEHGTKIAEAISYTVTQALLNIYNHAGATHATVQTSTTHGSLTVSITDNGRGFDPLSISPDKTSIFKAQLKAREAGGTMTIESLVRPRAEHGTTVTLLIPLPQADPSTSTTTPGVLLEPGNLPFL